MRTNTEHFVKQQLSPAREPRAGWERTVLMARKALEDRLTESLERDVESNLERLFRQAAASIPKRCPFTLDELRR